MNKDHKEKITKALDLCHSSIEELDGYFDKFKDDSPEFTKVLKQLLYQEAIFAGGMFRSTFTDTPVKDIDIFFKSHGAVLALQDQALKRPNLLGDPTPLGNYCLKINSTKYNLITMRYGEPESLINTFDFTFNKHYFYPARFEMKFDVDTFSKKGSLNSNGPNPIAILARFLRFQKEGFSFNPSTVRDVFYQMFSHGKRDEHGLLPDSVVKEFEDFYTQVSSSLSDPADSSGWHQSYDTYDREAYLRKDGEKKSYTVGLNQGLEVGVPTSLQSQAFDGYVATYTTSAVTTRSS